MIISTMDIQNSFGKYLKLTEHEDVIISKNGKKLPGLPLSRMERMIVNFTNHLLNMQLPMQKCNTKNFSELLRPLYPHQKAVKEIFGEFINWFRDKKCVWP